MDQSKSLCELKDCHLALLERKKRKKATWTQLVLLIDYALENTRFIKN